jgi:hypothetical protein
MDWTLARERLGAELIGARETVAARWRLALRERGATAWALERCAAELVLHAGAAIADAAPGETPWQRCGGLLLIDARDQGRALATEVSLLWQCMAGTLAQMAFTVEEDRLAREVLGRQMEAALRGASAELRASMLDERSEGAVRFGGVKALCRTTPDERPSDARAA